MIKYLQEIELDPDVAMDLLDVLNDDPDQEMDQDQVRYTEGGIDRKSEREREKL